MTNFDLAKKQTEELSRAFHNGVKQAHTQAIKQNKEIIKWLKSIVWCNAHDKAWIEETIEKLRRTK